MKKTILLSAVILAATLIQSCNSTCNCLSADGDTICKSEYESYGPQGETWEEFVAAEKADGAVCSN